MGIIVFILVITLSIALHEYGHYLACRAFKIPVLDFSVGMGKSLWNRRSKYGTVWNLRLLPIGGFISPAEDEMKAASPFAKAVIAAAGPLANLLPFALIALALGSLGEFLSILWEVYLIGFSVVGDVLLTPFHAMLGGAAQATGSAISGPIGLGDAAVTITAEAGALYTFFLLFIGINLGVGLFNLLPIPLLDGGRIVMAGAEAVLGRAWTMKIEKITNVLGVIFIVLMVLVVTTTDVYRLF